MACKCITIHWKWRTSVMGQNTLGGSGRCVRFYLFMYCRFGNVCVCALCSSEINERSAHASIELIRVVVLRRVRSNDHRANTSWQNQKSSYAHPTLLGRIPLQDSFRSLHVGISCCPHQSTHRHDVWYLSTHSGSIAFSSSPRLIKTTSLQRAPSINTIL